jgi:hypothetical protein
MKKTMIVFLLLAVAGTVVRAAQLEVLDTDISARGRVLGAAAAALGDDSSLFINNPGGLSYVTYTQTSLTYNKFLQDTRLMGVGFVYPFKRSGFGLQVVQFDAGQLDHYADGIYKETVNAKKDESVTVSFGQEIIEGLSAGISGKYTRSSLVEKYAVSAAAFDAGIVWRPSFEKYLVGVAVHNIGSALCYNVEDERLDTKAELGAGISICDTCQHRFIVEGGITAKRAAKNLAGNIAAEYTLNEMLTLRLGYSNDSIYFNPILAGIGFAVRGNTIDYTWANGGMEDIHRLSLGISFGQGGSYGKGEGYFKKGMYRYARNQFAKIPPHTVNYEKAQTLLYASDGEICARTMGKAQSSASFSSSRYPVKIQLMSHIPMAVFPCLKEYKAMQGTVRIDNKTDKSEEFLIKYKYDFETNENSILQTIESQGSITLPLYAAPPSSSIGKSIKEARRCEVTVSVYLLGKDGDIANTIVDKYRDTVIIYPNNQFFISVKNAAGEEIDLEDTLAAWVVPDDIAIIYMLSKAAKRGASCNPQVKIIGRQNSIYFTDGEKKIDSDLQKQIEVIYNTLKEDYGLTYLCQPIIDARPKMFVSQRVKFPWQTLYNKGDCIELSVLFASILESIDAHPVLMLMPVNGHCIVGWVENEEERTYHFLDTNLFGEEFDSVLSAGDIFKKQYRVEEIAKNEIFFNENGVFKNDDMILLDIKTIRKRISSSNYMPSAELFK